MLGCLQLADAPDPNRILDFGAGAGRVTRWIRAAFPQAEIDVCDLRAPDMEFCAREFRANSWVSCTDFESVSAPGDYDLVWLGSVATHLPEEKVISLIDKTVSWCKHGALILITFHGRQALAVHSAGFRYIATEQWSDIVDEYRAHGFGYADYPGESGYGISLAATSWVANVIEKRLDVRLLTLAERVWDNHHDVLALQTN